jgi:anti-sigma B factor antagonist
MSEPVIYVLTGRLDGGSAAGHEQALEAAITDSQPNLVIDMTGLNYVSSAGLRVLLVAAKRARGKGGDISLKRPSAAIREVLEISGFDKILKIVD